MNTVAFHTLGCKVNQYDTQAMLERFRAAGYLVVPFDGEADVYVVNTCTVTGTGDRKSLQIARRLRREHPDSEVILAGCLAQRRGEELLQTGARLILGTQRRGEVVDLLEDAVQRGVQLCAVSDLTRETPFEPLSIADQEEHTRAILKIQEGCNNRCTYCVIPSVRGPIRSRPVEDIAREAARLAEAGFTELVLTGIHLTSYGRDLDGETLLDAIEAVQNVPGVKRIRLGSLEPTVATETFAARLAAMDKVCPQFHLALQSGSDGVLRRMARRYNTTQYLAAVDNLRRAFPDCALTTDVLTGFPGETEEEYEETCAMIRRVGYARIHVFPFSPREGTPAATMPRQLPNAEKERRARALIALGRETAEAYREIWLNRTTEVLLEEQTDDGAWLGYTPEYIQVTVPDGPDCHQGALMSVRLTALTDDGMSASRL